MEIGEQKGKTDRIMIKLAHIVNIHTHTRTSESKLNWQLFKQKRFSFYLSTIGRQKISKIVSNYYSAMKNWLFSECMKRGGRWVVRNVKSPNGLLLIRIIRIINIADEMFGRGEHAICYRQKWTIECITVRLVMFYSKN